MTTEEAAKRRIARKLLDMRAVSERKADTDYFDTHGPWDYGFKVCLTCGLTMMAIHTGHIRCEDEI